MMTSSSISYSQSWYPQAAHYNSVIAGQRRAKQYEHYDPITQVWSSARVLCVCVCVRACVCVCVCVCVYVCAL